MCHHNSEKLAQWMRERETQEDEAPDDEFEDLADVDEDREPATTPADD